tara:strand:- start:3470 stop:3880 length:411 start_codon:yes stop_codon:yes gene_type:complete
MEHTSGVKMANKIVDLFQLDEGTRNPVTNLVEKPVWNIRFHDGTNIEDKLFFKSTILELLSVGYRKAVENFRRGSATTRSGGQAAFWIVVFQDYEVRLQTKDEIADCITEGHRKRGERENEESRETSNEHQEQPGV